METEFISVVGSLFGGGGPISPAHEKIVVSFLKDLREVVWKVSKFKEEPPIGEAALYGMMGTLPDRKMAKDLALQYLNDLYRLKE
jgi:sphinganine-1-phosphate aldolase